MASEPHFVDHLLPVWQALPKKLRGDFLTASRPLLGYIGERIGRKAQLARSRGSEHRPMLVCSVGDLGKSRRMGRTRVAYMEHGAGQSYYGDARTAGHPSYAGGRGRERCALIMAPNEMAAERWRASYPDTPVHVIGACRVLPPPAATEPLLAISFHWSGAMPEMQNAFSYYWPSLKALAQQLPVIGHGHPRMLGALTVRYRKAGIELVPDVQDVARRATVYAVDNSSTLYELALTRPVIAMNAPHYRRRVEHGLRFWSHIPGPQVDSPSELVTVAERLLAGRVSDAETQHRLDVARQVFPYLDGAQRASRLLVAWLSGSE